MVNHAERVVLELEVEHKQFLNLHRQQIAETEVKQMPDAVETKEDSPAKAEKKKEVEKEK